MAKLIFTIHGRDSLSVLKSFCWEFLVIYERMYLKQRPSQADLRRIESVYRNRRLDGCIGVVDTTFLSKSGGSLEGVSYDDKFELWLDDDWYCWNLEFLGDENGRQGCATEEEGRRSQLMNKVIEGKFNFELFEEGEIFCGKSYGMLKKLYFMSGICYPECEGVKKICEEGKKRGIQRTNNVIVKEVNKNTIVCRKAENIVQNIG